VVAFAKRIFWIVDNLSTLPKEQRPHWDGPHRLTGSSPAARARSIVAQCKAAGVACFVKWLGAMPQLHGFTGIPIRDRKGGDWNEWPEDLRVREFPE
jgi:hypothetical protein